MQSIHRLISTTRRATTAAAENRRQIILSRVFSTTGSGSNSKDGAFGSFDDLGWDAPTTSWSTGLTKDHFNGEAPTPTSTATGTGATGSESHSPESKVLSDLQEMEDKLQEMEEENRKSKAFVDGWKDRMMATSRLLKQVQEPGARGSYLKDSEKAEMYRLHKKNPEVYTVEKLAKDYRIMRQRVHAILWLKELEEEEEKKLGRPLDDSVELLLDTFPE